MKQYDPERLLQEAKKAEANAYAPYSKKANGAALLSSDGNVYTGCTVENMAYPISVCAAKGALVNAITKGTRSFIAIAVSGDGIDAQYLCGDCRQALMEFEADIDVISERNPAVVRRLVDLLPDAFEIAE